jgi:dipeptidyl-peptidase-4
MKKYTALFTGCLLAGGLFSVPSMAQKKKLSLEESMTNPSFSIPLKQIHGFADGSWAEVVSTGAKGDALVKRNGIKTDTLLFARDWKEGKKSFPRLSWKDGQNAWALWGNELSAMNLPTRKAQSLCILPEDAENQDVQEKTMAVAYTKGNNLFIRQGEKEYTVSAETDENIVSGQSVHRNEYGITKGTFWSPDGNQLAFYRMDQRMVTDYPLVDISEKPAKVKNIKYPMAGQTSHEVNLGVFNLQTAKTTYLQVDGPKDQYLTGITWTPDAKYITITLLNRATNLLKLNVYEAASGKFVKTLLEEKSDIYLDPQEGPLYINPALDFIWQTDRNGSNQLYLHGWDGRMKKLLSEGPSKVTQVLGLDGSSKKVLFVQADADGMDRMVKMTDLGSGVVKAISKVGGIHNPLWCDGKNGILDVWSNLAVPKQLDYISLSKNKAVQLKTFSSPFVEYDFPRIDTLSIKASDGQKLNGRLIYPTGFDPSKKYPVIVYVYGGPHAQMLTNSWMAAANTWMAAWASEGFAVFTIDNRGSHNRSAAFEKAPYRNLGNAEMEDQLRGVDFLKSLSWVDSSRIGVHGWSYGGFMTTTLMARAPGVFKVGIAGAPVIDWSMYEIMYTERYMDTPKENPKGYETSSLLNHAGKVKGKFMLIHGTSDDVVVWQHTQSFLKKAIEAGVQLDYFIYPGHGHGVGGKDRLHLMRKMTDYFKANL